MNTYRLLRKILYRLIWFLEKKLKSDLYLGNSRTIVDMQPENSFSENYSNFINSLKNNLVVKAGPFKGLKYPEVSLLEVRCIQNLLVRMKLN